MSKSAKRFVVLGCLLIAGAVAVKIMWLTNPSAALPLKSSSLLILANTAFLLALLLKK